MWTFTKVENGKTVISSSSFSDSIWKVDALDQLFLNFSMTKAPPNSIGDLGTPLSNPQTMLQRHVRTFSWSSDCFSECGSLKSTTFFKPLDGTLTADVFVSLLKQRLSLWPVSLLGRNVTLCVTVKTVGMRWSVVRTYSFFSASSHL